MKMLYIGMIAMVISGCEPLINVIDLGGDKKRIEYICSACQRNTLENKLVVECPKGWKQKSKEVEISKKKRGFDEYKFIVEVECK